MEEGHDTLKQLLVKLEDPADEGCRTRESDGCITCVGIFSIVIAVCGSFVVGCSNAYTSPVQSTIVSDLGLSTAEYSLFGSLLTIGGLLGSLVCGKITDYLGRRAIMGLADILYLVGWLTIALSQAAWSLDLGRLVLGFATSLIAYAVPVYIAEITPKSLRGGFVFLGQLMISCGITVVYLVGLKIGWRMLAVIGILPCMTQLFGLFFIPESPRWLVKLGDDKSFEAALQCLRGKHVDVSQEAADIKDFTEAVEDKEGNLLSLFSTKYALSLTVGLGLMALASFGGTAGILFYASSIFESARFSGSIGTISMALMQLPPLVIGVLLMDKVGRRPLLMYSASGLCAACLSLALSFLLKEHGWFTDYSPYLAYIGIMIFSAAYPIGMGGIPYVIMSEIFPMNIKWAAGSFAIIVGYLSDSIVSYSFNFMMKWSSSGTFFIFTSVNIFALLFIVKLVPETKGRTLEEIQASITL